MVTYSKPCITFEKWFIEEIYPIIPEFLTVVLKNII